MKTLFPIPSLNQVHFAKRVAQIQENRIFRPPFPLVVKEEIERRRGGDLDVIGTDADPAQERQVAFQFAFADENRNQMDPIFFLFQDLVVEIDLVLVEGSVLGRLVLENFAKVFLCGRRKAEEADDHLFPGDGNGHPLFVDLVFGYERGDQADPLGLLDLFLSFRPKRVNAVIHQPNPV